MKYFLLGRHFGFVPYFFPGVVALLAWALSSERRVAWRVLNLIGVAASALVLLVFLPYTWSGGGGPPGNRYFLGLSRVLLRHCRRSPGRPRCSWRGSAGRCSRPRC